MNAYINENFSFGKLRNGIEFIYLHSKTAEIEPIFLKEEFIDELKYIKQHEKIASFDIAQKLIKSGLVKRSKKDSININYDFKIRRKRRIF
ncbi:hypothetical protein [Caloranaerobacter sp. DY30410]|uniref:hypothetical protein n=1 Tax=Caloranaerobacter sp. DY30410 TaxID=3238305 RepID=UPI003D03CD3C